jgi:intracellular septation protein A
MFEYFKTCKNFLDYLPLVLVTILFVAEAEMEKHALHTSCQMVITITTLVIFYLMVMKFKNTKLLSLIVAVIVWITLVYIKKKYIPA